SSFMMIPPLIVSAVGEPALFYHRRLFRCKRFNATGIAGGFLSLKSQEKAGEILISPAFFIKQSKT
ncbi:MAG: hypothetical protein IJK60_08625, partial [Clostridia bacterium]|nr:hypothetical protein [Clostridia bacterium]